MQYRLLVFWSLCLLGCNLAIAQAAQKNVVSDLCYNTNKVLLSGFIGAKLEASIHKRMMAQDLQSLIYPFTQRNEERCWQSEFWGKWLTSAILAYRYQPLTDLGSKIDSAVTMLINTQTPDGYIGNYRADKHLEHWDIWGRKYCMLGLLAYHDLRKDKHSLSAASRMADHLIAELRHSRQRIVDKGRHRGMAATSILEPIVILYRYTGKNVYLDFAREIVSQWESADGPQLISKADVDVGRRFPMPSDEEWFGYAQGQKAYEMMSCYEGLLELYRVTGVERYKQAVEKVWNNINDTEINIAGSGSMKECWFNGRKFQAQVPLHYQETCVTATWIKLSYQLFKLTGEPKYAAAIEQSYYNALLGAIADNGASWAVYSPLMGIRSIGEMQCRMGLNCCIASGPRALFLFPFMAVMRTADGVSVSQFNPGKFQTTTPGGQVVNIIQETMYPQYGEVRIIVRSSKAESYSLHIRVPEWSNQTTISNGGQKKAVSNGTYFTIHKKWGGNDTLVLKLDMHVRLHTLQSNPGFLALKRGPLLLARDKRFTGEVDIDEIITPSLYDKTNGEILPEDQLSYNGTWVMVNIPCVTGSYRVGVESRPKTLQFCDYASAGSTYADDSRFRVWYPQLLVPETIKNQQRLPD
ncbi:beta-L-arabinofuranosidase domain-containing protein [Niabella sp. 22666]|uniref:beta-L-arabinofuranosidase domain-containing protein n=1 Tax=Niabella sp. 22666 TaxID=3453954 RepID=UPI003F8569AA